MTKIFTIGFSGKSPEAFQDVLNAARISCVWDIRQWQNFQGGRSQSCRARQVLITPTGDLYFLCGDWDYE